MFSSLGPTTMGAIMLVLFGVFYWLSIFATVRAILAFVGTILLGSSGFIGSGLQTAVQWVVNLGGTASGWAFGVATGGMILTIVTLVIFVHDLHPKKTAGKRTGWAGVALAALLLAGVSGIPALNGVPNSVRTGVHNAQTIGGGH